MAGDEQLWRNLWWQQADEVRHSPRRPDMLALIRAAFAGGRAMDWRTLAAVTRYGEATIVDPQIVAEFALAYTAEAPPQRVLDPWAGLGVTLAALDAANRLESGLAIEINEAVYGLARELSASQTIDWRLGDAAEVLDGTIGLFDLVVGSPPIGLPTARLRSDRPALDLQASKTYTMLVQVGLALRSEGAMLVVLPEAFFGPANAKVRHALAAASIFPSAALALPASSYATSISLSLVVLGGHDTTHSSPLNSTPPLT